MDSQEKLSGWSKNIEIDENLNGFKEPQRKWPNSTRCNFRPNLFDHLENDEVTSCQNTRDTFTSNISEDIQRMDGENANKTIRPSDQCQSLASQSGQSVRTISTNNTSRFMLSSSPYLDSITSFNCVDVEGEVAEEVDAENSNEATALEPEEPALLKCVSFGPE